MSIVPAKCTSCGANIQVDNTKEASICEYCHTPFVVSKAVEAAVAHTNNAQNVIYNNYYSGPAPVRGHGHPQGYQSPPPPPPRSIPRRPRVNGGLLVIGCIFGVWPGLIYLAYKLFKQHEWDREFGNKR